MSELHEIIKRSRGLAPLTKRHYLGDIDQWIEFAGENPIGWTRARAQEFYDYLLDVRKLRPQSANRVIASLQFASKWYAHFQNRPEADFAYVQRAKAHKFDEKRALRQDEATKLLLSIKHAEAQPADLRDFAIIVTLLETGMRKMSLVSMSIERTLIDAERLAATRTAYPLAWVRVKGAGNEDVSVPLSDTAIAALTPWRVWLAMRGITKGPLFRGLGDKMGPRGPITTAAKTKLTLNAINKLLDRRAAAAGIGHIYPHQFRHTFVTWRMMDGLLPHEVAAFTGHAVRNMGAMEGYIDNTMIALKVRNSTPGWLRELVEMR